MARQEIRSLTGLRGLAAVFVMLYHFTGAGRSSDEPMLSGPQFLSHGYLSVDLFFVLSGFVMALTYRRMFVEASRTGVRGTLVALPVFLGHRIARIYPLYIVMTLLAAVVHAFGVGHADPIPNFVTTLVANVFMVQAWGLAQSIVWPAWSISTEWGSYLVFPLLLALCVTGTRVLAWVVGLAAAAALVLLATTDAFGGPFEDRMGQLDIWQHTSIAPLLRCVAGFVFGLLTYRVYRRASASLLRALAAVSPLVLAMMVASCLWPDTDLVWVALVPLLILGLATDRGFVAQALGWAPLHQLGVLSYAVYLVHPRLTKLATAGGAALKARDIPFANAIAVLVAVTLVITAAYMAHRLVEVPGRRWLRRGFDRFTRTRASVLAGSIPASATSTGNSLSKN